MCRCPDFEFGRKSVCPAPFSPTRRVFPGVWDIVGGHVEAGETAEGALGREIEEETGWRLRRIVARIVDWGWEHDGVLRHEADYIVEVDGDLSAPQLENGKHDAHAWVGPNDLELMTIGRKYVMRADEHSRSPHSYLIYCANELRI